MPEQDAPALIVRRSLSKAVLLTFASLGFAFGGAAIAFHWLPVKSGSLAEFAGWVCLIVFGAATFPWAGLVLDRRPTIEIGPEGILDRRISEKILPWGDVKAIRPTEIRRTKFLAFDLTPGARERLGGKFMRRYADKLSARMGYGDYSFATTGLDTSFETVADAITKAWPNARQGRGG